MHHDLVSVLSRSGRIWSDDHLQIRVAANPAYDAGKRVHIPSAGLVGSIRTRRRHPDDFNPYEPTDTTTPLPPGPDDGPAKPITLQPTPKAPKTATKASQPAASTSHSAASAAEHAPAPHQGTALVERSRTPSTAEPEAVQTTCSRQAEASSVTSPSTHQPWQPPARPPRFRLVLPPVWHFLATKVHDATPACVKQSPPAPKPAPCSAVPSISAEALPPAAAAIQFTTVQNTAHPPAA